MSEPTQKTIHKLELNEYVLFEDETVKANCYILRVPGGWIYNFSDLRSSASVFVPYRHEFKETAEEYEVHKLE